jgi:hypothetical protein
MFKFRQGGRKGRTAARHSYSEGTFYYCKILRILSKICESFNPLMHEDWRILESGEKNWKLVAIR